MIRWDLFNRYCSAREQRQSLVTDDWARGEMERNSFFISDSYDEKAEDRCHNTHTCKRDYLQVGTPFAPLLATLWFNVPALISVICSRGLHLSFTAASILLLPFLLLFLTRKCKSKKQKEEMEKKRSCMASGRGTQSVGFRQVSEKILCTVRVHSLVSPTKNCTLTPFRCNTATV